jgi:hypothetical protein
MRLIKQGGVRVNGTKAVTDGTVTDGAVVQVGKLRSVRVKVR